MTEPTEGSISTEDAVPHVPPFQEDTISEVMGAVWDEIDRQDQLARAGKFGGTHIMPGGTDDGRLRVLVEEVGEVAIEMNEADIAGVERTDDLYKELVQVAAVAAAWAAAVKEGRPA